MRPLVAQPSLRPHWLPLLIAILTIASWSVAHAQQAPRVVIDSWSEGIDWQTDLALKGTTHEHTKFDVRIAHMLPDSETTQSFRDAYPGLGTFAAPYNWVGLHNYSGSYAVNAASYWREVHWPLASWAGNAYLNDWTTLPEPSRPYVIFPSTENGLISGPNRNATHMSAFGIESYIQEAGLTNAYIQTTYGVSEPAHSGWVQAPLADQFASQQEFVDLVHARGGLAGLNHPQLSQLGSYPAGYDFVEVYNAFFRQRKRWYDDGLAGVCSTRSVDMNQTEFEPVFDALLDLGRRPCPVAVNDWAGLWARPTKEESAATCGYNATIVDSGYTMLYASEATFLAVKNALASCHAFAVMDLHDGLASVKGDPPLATDVAVSPSRTSIQISAPATVRWISDGGIVRGTGSSFDLHELPVSASWLRAEIGPDADGSMVWTPAWTLELAIDPFAIDSDGDLLSDGAELDEWGSDPLAPDSDGDGYDDGSEIAAGTDPLDPASHPLRPHLPLLSPGAGLLASLLLLALGAALADGSAPSRRRG